ncbi:carbonic anhydrase [Marasmius fiardii PR-910]|nr:carbonic anhydrase [Marasmius fiardii PR-910]
MFRLTFTLVLLATSNVLTAYCSCLHGTSLLRREVNGGKVAVSTFGYDEGNGLLWGVKSPNNTACNSGRTQSPIVLNSAIPDSPPITVSIPSVPSAVFENLGSTLEVIVNGTTNFQGKDYFLKQFHFHTPSEHRINGEHYPLEMHMVHQSADGSFVVLAILYDLSQGTTTDLLRSVSANINTVTEPGSIGETGSLDFTQLSETLMSQPKFHYSGSLTTPPCAEGINFVVLKEPLALDVNTYNTMKKIMKFNSRYTSGSPGQANLLEAACAKSGE